MRARPRRDHEQSRGPDLMVDAAGENAEARQPHATGNPAPARSMPTPDQADHGTRAPTTPGAPVPASRSHGPDRPDSHRHRTRRRSARRSAGISLGHRSPRHSPRPPSREPPRQRLPESTRSPGAMPAGGRLATRTTQNLETRGEQAGNREPPCCQRHINSGSAGNTWDCPDLVDWRGLWAWPRVRLG